MRRLLPALLFPLAAGLGALPAAAAGTAATGATEQRFTLRCPAGTRPEVRGIKTYPFERSGGLAPPQRELVCVGADRHRDGPALLLRPGMRSSVTTLLRLTVLRPSQIAWVGAYRDDLPAGVWRQVGRNGERLGELDFGDGKGRIAWRVRDEAGVDRVRGAIEAGARVGRWQIFDDKGVLRAEASFRGDALHGELRTLWPEGTPHTTIAYEAGVQSGLETRWWRNGRKRVEAQWRAGMRDGQSCQWNEHGELLGCNTLRDGSGPWREWFDHGGLSAEGAMLRGRRDGPWQMYYESGVLRAQGVYREGRQSREVWRTFDRDGTPARPRAVEVRGSLGAAGVGGGVGVLRGSGSGGGTGGIIGRLRAVGGTSRAKGPTLRMQVFPAAALPPGQVRQDLETAIGRCAHPLRNGRPARAVVGVLDIELTPSGTVQTIKDRLAPVYPAWQGCVHAAVRGTPFAGGPQPQRLTITVMIVHP